MGLAGILLVAQLGAVDADVGVVLSRRDGVTKTQAQDVSKACSSALSEAGITVGAAVLDGTKCAAKKPCFVALGRKQSHQVLVILEVASVLDDGLVRAEAISVDEDGKQLAKTEYSGALNNKAGLAAAFAKLVPAVTAATHPPAEPAPVAKAEPAPAPAPPPEPKKVEPAPAPPAAVVQAPAPSGPSGKTVAGIVLLAAGGGAGIAAGIMGAQALVGVTKVNTLCPVRNQCSDPNAAVAFQEAQLSQNLGIGLAAGAGALAIAGIVVLLTGNSTPETPKVAATLLPGGAAASVSFAW